VIDTLRQRNFALLWFGGLISTMGNWILNVALPFYVYERTGSVLATSIMFMTFWIPGILLGSVAGVFVDRWDRRRTLVASNLLQTAVVLLLLVLVFAPSQEWLWLAYAVPFVQSCINQFSGPAEGALLPSLVSEERLVPANSLNALNDNIGRLAGPPVGGALIGLFGLGSVVLVDGLTFLFAAAMISLVSVPRKHVRGEDMAEESEEIETATGRWAAVWRDWLRGLRIVRRDRLIAVLFLVSAIATFADGILTPLLVPFADDVLGGGAASYGWLYTVRGIGGLVGGVIVAQWGAALGPARLIAVCPVIDGLVLFVVFNVPSLPLAIALFGLVSVPFVAFSTSLQALLQSDVPDEYRGRVMGALSTTAALVWLGGSALSGTLGDVLGVVLMLNVSAGLLILTGLVGLLVRREPCRKTTGEASTASRG
jgi:MFS family permease